MLLQRPQASDRPALPHRCSLMMSFMCTMRSASCPLTPSVASPLGGQTAFLVRAGPAPFLLPTQTAAGGVQSLWSGRAQCLQRAHFWATTILVCPRHASLACLTTVIPADVPPLASLTSHMHTQFLWSLLSSQHSFEVSCELPTSLARAWQRTTLALIMMLRRCASWFEAPQF